MLSGFLDVFTGFSSYLVNDSDIAEAVNNAYSAICYNKDKSSGWTCKYNISDVGYVIWAYINYFTTNPDRNAKYYFDEVSDRNDPYRKELVIRISQTINQNPEFTNEVLSYLYWGIKRNKVAKGILEPREVQKFHDPDYWYNGIFGGLFKITTEMYRFAEKVLKDIGYVISEAAKGMDKLFDIAGKAMNYLPYIVGIGAVGFVGFQIYKYKKVAICHFFI